LPASVRQLPGVKEIAAVHVHKSDIRDQKSDKKPTDKCPWV